jgi:hypothetical protein
VKQLFPLSFRIGEAASSNKKLMMEVRLYNQRTVPDLPSHPERGQGVRSKKLHSKSTFHIVISKNLHYFRISLVSQLSNPSLKHPFILSKTNPG